jgi:hypothetical protein
VASPDAYDDHVAMVTVDGESVGYVDLGSEADFEIEPGRHEVGVRLQANFGTAKIAVAAPEGGTVTVTCEKAHSARTQVLHPSRLSTST